MEAAGLQGTESVGFLLVGGYTAAAPKQSYLVGGGRGLQARLTVGFEA
jgi:hypothetical protein